MSLLNDIPELFERHFASTAQRLINELAARRPAWTRNAIARFACIRSYWPFRHHALSLADASQIVVSISRNRIPEMADAPSRRLSASRSETERPTARET